MENMVTRQESEEQYQQPDTYHPKNHTFNPLQKLMSYDQDKPSSPSSFSLYRDEDTREMV